MNSPPKPLVPFIFGAVATVLVILALSGCTVQHYDAPPEPEYDDRPYYDEPAPVDYDMFYELDFWGTWYWLEPYGWVWRPTVTLSWRPFLRGHWIWSDYGWMWVSYEPFGWATCHYGYWAYDFALGWVWSPGYEWYPHRVHWIVVDDYVCWAPAPAPGFRYDYPWYTHKVEIWVVVRNDHFTHPDVGRYESRPRFKSQYRENEVQYREPGTDNIGRAVGRPIRRVNVKLEKVKVKNHDVTRIDLPESQRRIVERYGPREQQKNKDARGDNRYERERPPGESRDGEQGKTGGRREPKQKPKAPDPKAKPGNKPDEPEVKEEVKRPAKKRSPDKPVKQQPNREPEKNKEDRGKDDGKSKDKG